VAANSPSDSVTVAGCELDMAKSSHMLTPNPSLHGPAGSATRLHPVSDGDTLAEGMVDIGGILGIPDDDDVSGKILKVINK